MVIYDCYLTATKNAKTAFMKIVDLFNGTIDTALLEYLESKNLPLAKRTSLGTDGAKVMTGRINGVGARLKRCQPMLTGIHCVCHRLALAAAQAGKDVTFIDKRFNVTALLFLSKQFCPYVRSKSNRRASIIPHA